MLTGLSQIFELLKREPQNRLLRKRYLQLVGGLPNLEEMKEHLIPLMNLMVKIDVKEAFYVAARLRAVDPQNKKALEVLAKGYEEFGEFQKSSKMRQLINQRQSQSSDPKIFKVESTDTGFYDPNQPLSSPSQLPQVERSMQGDADGNIFGDEQQNFNFEGEDSQQQNTKNLPLPSEESHVESASSPLDIGDPFQKEDQTKILPGPKEMVPGILDTHDVPKHPEPDPIEHQHLAADMEMPHALPSNELDYQPDLFALDADEKQDEASSQEDTEMEPQVKDAVKEFEAELSLEIVETPMSIKEEVAPSHKISNLPKKGELSFKNSFQPFLNQISLGLILKNLDLSQTQPLSITSTKVATLDLLKLVSTEYCIRHENSYAFALMALSSNLKGRSVTDVLIKSIYQHFHQGLYRVILARLLREGRFRKVNALVYRFFEDLQHQHRQPSLEALIVANENLGRVVKLGDNQELNVRELPQFFRFKRSAIYSRLYR